MQVRAGTHSYACQENYVYKKLLNITANSFSEVVTITIIIKWPE